MVSQLGDEAVARFQALQALFPYFFTLFSFSLRKRLLCASRRSRNSFSPRVQAQAPYLRRFLPPPHTHTPAYARSFVRLPCLLGLLYLLYLLYLPFTYVGTSALFAARFGRREARSNTRRRRRGGEGGGGGGRSR
jgi:hypothetical protein